MDRGLDQPPCAGPQKLRQGVGNPCWRHQRNHSIVAHVRCAPLAESVTFTTRFQQRHAARLNSIQTPLSTIARFQPLEPLSSASTNAIWATRQVPRSAALPEPQSIDLSAQASRDSPPGRIRPSRRGARYAARAAVSRYQSIISDPVAFHTFRRRTMWPSASSRKPMRQG